MNQANIRSLAIQGTSYALEKEQLVQEEIFKREKAVVEEQLKRQRQTGFVLILLIAALLLAGWIAYRYFQTRNKSLALDLKNKKIIEQQANELKKYNEELRQLDETKTQFFTNVSHEFKTPLTLILNPVSRLISNGRLNDEDKFLAQSAEKNSLQLLSLTNQVLELTKFEVDKVSNQPSAFNLATTARKLHADFESLAVSQKIQFDYTIDVDETLNLYFDYTKFTTILKNLLSNAVKFTPENGTVLFNVLEKEGDIEIQFIDNGRGIHPSDLPNIFKRYYQANLSSQIQEGGTGIGLAICAEYTKLLGGDIRVQSAYGEGSTFILTLPKTTAPEGTSTNMIAESKSNNVEIVPTPSIQNKALPTLLLVEDNIDLQNYLKLILQHDYQLEIASHGKAALTILEKKHQSIQLIISDVMMPEMNGYELLERLKQNTNYSNIPTVMLTALSGMDDKLKALRIGIDDYLTKPFSDEELKARIVNLIQNRTERLAYLQDTEPTQHINTIKNNQKDLQWLEELEIYINRNLRYSLSTEMIATQMNISKKTLYNKIKQLTGLTSAKYINEIRYQAARRLIAENKNWTVKAIALNVGFKDEKNFSRNFKKRFGKYPSEILKMNA